MLVVSKLEVTTDELVWGNSNELEVSGEPYFEK
jgi:hypothetical protein